MAAKQYNLRNPGVKRIMQEIKEMQKDTSKEYVCRPLEEDIFEWQFAVHGPPDTEFQGGIYHGRIILPSEYPFKPPSFMLLTPSGRFEVQKKICLSISQHHPEHWQPSWSVRTALVALIAFMPTKGDGALGALDFSKEERIAMAKKSRLAPPKFGSAERQAVIDKIHQEMLSLAPPLPSPSNEESEQGHNLVDSQSTVVTSEQSTISDTLLPTTSLELLVNSGKTSGTAEPATSSSLGNNALAATSESAPVVSAIARPQVPSVKEEGSSDMIFYFLIIAIIVAILAIIARKAVVFGGEGRENLP